MFKLKNVSGEIIEDDLDKFASKLKTQDIKDPALLEVIENAKWVKETNSILLTGNSAAIEEAKLLISQFDIPRKEKSLSLHDQFFIYKPEHTSAEYIKQSLKDIASSLKKADLADPNFLNAIK